AFLFGNRRRALSCDARNVASESRNRISDCDVSTAKAGDSALLIVLSSPRRLVHDRSLGIFVQQPPIVITRPGCTVGPILGDYLHMNTRYISPAGSGLRDGSSPQNAGTLEDLNSFVSAVGAGGQVLLLADKGTYHQPGEVTLTHGGSAGVSVTIRGIDSHGDAMTAHIAGARAANWTPGHEEGSELFRLKSGADNLNFRDLAVSNVGDGVFRAGADIHNLSISHVAAAN